MNPYEYKPTPVVVPRKTSILASDGWHRFVTVICLLGCIVLTASGIAQLIVLARTQPINAGTMAPVVGVGMTLLGLLGCRFLWRQLRPPQKRPAKKS